MAPVGDRPVPERVRLDVWLDVACLYRTRSEARKACLAGHIEVNGQPAKPHREVRPGDRIDIVRPRWRRQVVVVRSLAGRHVPRAEARLLYEDATPPPTPEERELRALMALARPTRPASAGTPDRRERRVLRVMKERGSS
jgi:ribosome-associated heat shock protein Hsp15